MLVLCPEDSKVTFDLRVKLPTAFNLTQPKIKPKSIISVADALSARPLINQEIKFKYFPPTKTTEQECFIQSVKW